MFAKSVFVTGCSRGIGLEWIKQLAQQTEHLFAGCRSPHLAKELQAIADEYKHVIVLPLDVTNEESIEKAVKEISNVVGEDGLNCLINNAAIAHRIDAFDDLTIDAINETHQTNLLGPIRVVKKCLPLLKLAASRFYNYSVGISRASILNVSSDFASLELTCTTENLCYAYRMSKAALNMLTRMLGAEYKKDGIFVVSVHPGWVKTDMGGANGEVSTEESVSGMIKVVRLLKQENNGSYYAWNGSTLPW